MPPDTDVEADVVVVGFGAAGACAALEAAAAGCSVLVLDRFGGGGATALSGGVLYAGGGTPQQHAAGVTDSPEAMFAYLLTEVGDAVPAASCRSRPARPRIRGRGTSGGLLHARLAAAVRATTARVLCWLVS